MEITRQIAKGAPYGYAWRDHDLEKYAQELAHIQTMQTSLSIMLNDTVLGFIDQVVALIGLPKLAVTFKTDDFIEVKFVDLIITIYATQAYPFQKMDRPSSIEFFGSYENVEKAYTALYPYKTMTDAALYWYYREGANLKDMRLEVPKPKPIYDEFYPWIKPGVDQFIENFMKSESNCLILLGDPGTGKTSFIRYLAHKESLKIMTTFDEDIMMSDEFFIQFVTSHSIDTMILEDADLLLLPRESHENRIMSKLLNMTDGLIKLPNKKLIFTANLRNVNQIDPALIRPGRCFDILNFRGFTRQEAINAMEAAGIDGDARNDMTLADIFNPIEADNVTRIPTKVGFM